MVIGVWQTFDAICAGTWVLTTGVLLLRDRPLIGRLLVVLGAGLWVLAGSTMLGIHSLAVLAAILALVLLVWVVWIVLTRTPGGSIRGSSP